MFTHLTSPARGKRQPKRNQKSNGNGGGLNSLKRSPSAPVNISGRGGGTFQDSDDDDEFNFSASLTTNGSYTDSDWMSQSQTPSRSVAPSHRRMISSPITSSSSFRTPRGRSRNVGKVLSSRSVSVRDLNQVFLAQHGQNSSLTEPVVYRTGGGDANSEAARPVSPDQSHPVGTHSSMFLMPGQHHSSRPTSPSEVNRALDRAQGRGIGATEDGVQSSHHTGSRRNSAVVGSTPDRPGKSLRALDRAQVIHSSGYDISLCVFPPPEDLRCSLCTNLMRDALGTNVCGHVFCEGCIKDWLNKHPYCPVDGVAICLPNLVPRKGIRKRVDETHVKCHRRECYATVRVCDLIRHLENECQSRLVPCEICGKKVIAMKMKEHNAESAVLHVDRLLERRKESDKELSSLRIKVNELQTTCDQQRSDAAQDRQTIKQLHSMLESLQKHYVRETEMNKRLRQVVAPSNLRELSSSRSKTNATAASSSTSNPSASPLSQFDSPAGRGKRVRKKKDKKKRREQDKEKRTHDAEELSVHVPNSSSENEGYLSATDAGRTPSSSSFTPVGLSGTPLSLRDDGISPFSPGRSVQSRRDSLFSCATPHIRWDVRSKHSLVELSDDGLTATNAIGLASKTVASETVFSKGVYMWEVDLSKCRNAVVGLVDARFKAWNRSGCIGYNIPGWSFSISRGRRAFQLSEDEPVTETTLRPTVWSEPLRILIKLDLNNSQLSIADSHRPSSWSVLFSNVHGRVRPAITLPFSGDTATFIPPRS